MSDKSVLIIGQDTRFVDFSGLPPSVTPASITEGLDASADQLKAAGHAAELLMVDDGATAGHAVAERLRDRRFDVVVIGAGLRIMPQNAQLMETLVNMVHSSAPQAKIAFNTTPADSGDAALRFL